MVIPLGFFSLVENIIVQMVSFIVLIAVLLQWCAAFGQEGLQTDLLPAVGPNSTTVLGIVIFNYSFITTVNLSFLHINQDSFFCLDPILGEWFKTRNEYP